MAFGGYLCAFFNKLDIANIPCSALLALGINIDAFIACGVYPICKVGLCAVDFNQGRFIKWRVVDVARIAINGFAVS